MVLGCTVPPASCDSSSEDGLKSESLESTGRVLEASTPSLFTIEGPAVGSDSGIGVGEGDLSLGERESDRLLGVLD